MGGSMKQIKKQLDDLKQLLRGDPFNFAAQIDYYKLWGQYQSIKSQKERTNIIYVDFTNKQRKAA
jgi:hypothetical protein